MIESKISFPDLRLRFRILDFACACKCLLWTDLRLCAPDRRLRLRILDFVSVSKTSTLGLRSSLGLRRSGLPFRSPRPGPRNPGDAGHEDRGSKRGLGRHFHRRREAEVQEPTAEIVRGAACRHRARRGLEQRGPPRHEAAVEQVLHACLGPCDDVGDWSAFGRLRALSLAREALGGSAPLLRR